MTTTREIVCDAATVPEGGEFASNRPSAVALQPSQCVGGYQIKRMITQNHAHTVYLAHSIIDKKQVVLKEYFPSVFAERDKKGRVIYPSAHTQAFELGKRHLLEASCFLMQSLHPNLVKVDAVFEANKTVYMVMPYMQGQTLFQYLCDHKRVSQPFLLKLLRPLVEALRLVHDHACIHRDLKPSNIYLMRNGQPILLDFGSSLFIQHISSSSQAAVSPGYSPIEQYSVNSEEQGVWTDIYCLGASLYRAVVGKVPVDAMERGQRIIKELEDPYQPLVQCASDDYSLRFLSAIDHALCFRPQDRPANLSAWMDEIQGRTPVWAGHDQVKKSLMVEAARRYMTIDFDLGK